MFYVDCSRMFRLSVFHQILLTIKDEPRLESCAILNKDLIIRLNRSFTTIDYFMLMILGKTINNHRH
jgi:hypothetical protein